MTALIILAAGSSSRLGQAKQNLVFQGKTLLQRAVDTALVTSCSPVIMILGGNKHLISVETQANLSIIHTPNWQQGISSSIRAGIEVVNADEQVNDAVFMLCDQPYVNAGLIEQLIVSRQQTNKNIIACNYKNTIGVPALFSRSLFNELLKLKGDEGAKRIIMQHPDDVASIDFEPAGVDIDTLEDLEELLRPSNE